MRRARIGGDPGARGQRRAERLSVELARALVHGEGTNDLLHRLVQAVASILDAPRIVLYDYDERVDTFDLLHFRGFPDDARSDLRTHARRIDLGRARDQRDPYASHGSMLVPLYFQETLEAVLLLEGRSDELPGLEHDADALRLVSRFLGLFLSSSRLPINQRAAPASSADLARAREVQVSYLPPEYAATDRYEIYGYNQSAALVGGDYFDYFCGREDSLQFVLADACGHGLAATLTLCAFRGMLHRTMERSAELQELFDALNRQLYAGTDHVQFLTGIFCAYEPALGQLHYFNAGHFAPLLIRGDGAVLRLPGRGRPLGMFADSSYEMRTTTIERDDLLVLYTDGLSEIQNASEDHFGCDGILSAVLEYRRLPLRQLAGRLLTSAARFSHTPRPDDDLTLFLVRFL